MPLAQSGDRPSDTAGIEERLRARGLSPGAAAEKVRLFARARDALKEMSGRSHASGLRAFFVPGRIEVLGKHTDYAGGSSLVTAAERGFCVSAGARSDATLRLVDVGRGKEIQIPIHAELASAAGHWSHYPATVARRLARNFPGTLRGADIAFISDLPSAAGLSSSSALIVATFLVLAEFNSFRQSTPYTDNIKTCEDLAGYAGTVENGRSFGTLEGSAGVGTFGGSEDHTAILCSLAGQLSQFAYCPVRLERRVALPPGYVFAVASSGVAAEKTGAARAKYNRVSELASDIVRVWREATGREETTLQAIVGGSSAARERLAGLLRTRPSAVAEALIRRLEHFRAESGSILPAAVDALAQGDLEDFGLWADRSQALSESLLGNQVPETIFLARSARELGAAAASAFGAGFGGSVWALITVDSLKEFLRDWADAYSRSFPEHRESSALWATRAGPAAFGFSLDSTQSEPQPDRAATVRERKASESIEL